MHQIRCGDLAFHPHHGTCQVKPFNCLRSDLQSHTSLLLLFFQPRAELLSQNSSQTMKEMWLQDYKEMKLVLTLKKVRRH